MSRRVALLPAVLACFGVLFGWLFHQRYWIWRDCIEAAESSCVTPEGANLTSGGMIWGVFCILFLAIAILLFRRSGRGQR